MSISISTHYVSNMFAPNHGGNAGNAVSPRPNSEVMDGIGRGLTTTTQRAGGDGAGPTQPPETDTEVMDGIGRGLYGDKTQGGGDATDRRLDVIA